MADLPITRLNVGTMTGNSLFPTSEPNASTGRMTTKLSGTQIGEGILNNIDFAGLNTSAKNVIPAINEMFTAGGSGVAVSGILVAGNTSITLSHSDIQADSFIDVFCPSGISPLTVTKNVGSVTLTFTAQAVDIEVAIVVRGIVKVEVSEDNVLFSNGEWKMTDKFNVVISPTGASDISIVDGNLVYGATSTGFSVSPVDTTKQFWVQCLFQTSNNANFLQCGRCAIGADAKRCQTEGYQRYSWHDFSNVATGKDYSVYDGCREVGQALFFSGHNRIVSKIFAGIVDTTYNYDN